MQGGIERALRDLHDVARDLLEALSDSVAVDGAQGDDFEDEEIERALG